MQGCKPRPSQPGYSLDNQSVQANPALLISTRKRQRALALANGKHYMGSGARSLPLPSWLGPRA